MPSLLTIQRFSEMVFWTRVPIGAWLFLVFFGPLASDPMRTLLGNILLVEGPAQICWVTLACTVASTIISVQASVIMRNANERFRCSNNRTQQASQITQSNPSWTWFSLWGILWYIAWLLPALSLPISCVRYSYANGLRLEPLHIIGIVSGFFVAVVILFIAAMVSSCLIRTRDTTNDFLPWLQLAARCAGLYCPRRQPIDGSRFVECAGLYHVSGFARKETEGEETTFALAPGHLELAAIAIVVGMIYMFIGVCTDPHKAPGPQNWLPPTSYVVLVAMIIFLTLGVLAFFLDAYRIPVSTLALVWVIFVYTASVGREHVFGVVPRDQTMKKEEELSLSETLTNWDGTGERFSVVRGKRTLVAITAPGGGIHAAAWTARVLTGLHKRYGRDFAESIGVISAVSGGSVGINCYLQRWDELMEADKDTSRLTELFDRINNNARDSSLEAVAFGVAYEDVWWSTIPITPMGLDKDPGWELEHRWRDVVGEPKEQPKRSTLRKWARKARTSRFPVVAFNATEVENGRRVVFGTAKLFKHDSSPSGTRAFEILPQLCPERDVEIVTAVRMSATFPYVTPMAKPNTGLDVGYLADGGYSDNEGIATIIDAIKDLDHDNMPYDRILLIRIQHEPTEGKQAVGIPQNSGPSLGDPFVRWARPLIGPLQAMITVRTASQAEHAAIDADLLKRLMPTKLGVVEITFRPDEGSIPPLSWKLSSSESLKYDPQWEEANKVGFDLIDEWFPKVATPDK